MYHCTVVEPHTDLLSPVYNATVVLTQLLQRQDNVMSRQFPLQQAPMFCPDLLSPVHNATAVLARLLQWEHASRPPLLFAVGRDP